MLLKLLWRTSLMSSLNSKFLASASDKSLSRSSRSFTTCFFSNLRLWMVSWWSARACFIWDTFWGFLMIWALDEVPRTLVCSTATTLCPSALVAVALVAETNEECWISSFLVTDSVHFCAWTFFKNSGLIRWIFMTPEFLVKVLLEFEFEGSGTADRFKRVTWLNWATGSKSLGEKCDEQTTEFFFRV